MILLLRDQKAERSALGYEKSQDRLFFGEGLLHFGGRSNRREGDPGRFAANRQLAQSSLFDGDLMREPIEQVVV